LGLAFSVNAATSAEAEVGVLLEEGFQHLEAGRPLQAQERFNRALTVDPSSVSAREGLMWAYLEIGDLTKSLQFGDAMRGLAPNDMRILLQWVKISANDPKRGKEVLAAADRISREAPELANSLGYIRALMWTYYHLDDTVNALHYAERLRVHAPEDIEPIRYWMEVVVLIPAMQDELLVESEWLFRVKQDDIDTVEFVADILRRSGAHHLRAVEIYKHLLWLDPNHAEALFELARDAKFNGDLITAMQFLERAQAAHPESDKIKNAVMEIHVDAERLRRAKIGPTMPIVLAITLLPLLFGTIVRSITLRTYMVIAAHAALVSLGSLFWLYLFPLD
jgi:tetratricopeptide (TPR) repeat protein